MSDTQHTPLTDEELKDMEDYEAIDLRHHAARAAVDIRTLREHKADLLVVLKCISEMAGQTLLGPDSRHHMGDAATCYYEQGANAAFGQAAELASDAIDNAEDKP